MKKMTNNWFAIYIPQIFMELWCKNKLIINAWLKVKFGKVYSRNWGDELNYYFIQELTGKKVFNYTSSLLSRFLCKPNYMCIGSLIGESNTQTIIWGSGAISDKIAMKNKPKQVLAVRGPLTRKYLLDNNIECPDIYGDPALLLPYIYKPNKIKKKYNLGIIPHIHDQDNEYLKNFINQYKNKVKFIDLQNYTDWHDIINTICECEFILSSSLHGIIVSDAYNVPNCWIKLSDKLEGGKFKFLDYYGSVHNPIQEPYIINSAMNLDELLKLKGRWIKPQINLKKLIEVCPFPIQNKLQY